MQFSTSLFSVTFFEFLANLVPTKWFSAPLWRPAVSHIATKIVPMVQQMTPKHCFGVTRFQIDFCFVILTTLATFWLFVSAQMVPKIVQVAPKWHPVLKDASAVLLPCSPGALRNALGHLFCGFGVEWWRFVDDFWWFQRRFSSLFTLFWHEVVNHICTSPKPRSTRRTA